jgi:predicted lysophospholipase L1 biosynthesis ABC-type transport system permease subunit
MEPAGVWYTIVGVARALPQQGPLAELRPLVYASLEAEPAPEGRAAIIVRGPVREATARLRQEVEALDPHLPLFAIETLEQARARGRLPQRLISVWFGTLAAVALVLATVGVFAVTAHNVTERTHEIGVRMALGADAREVVRLFLVRTVLQLIVAIGLGLAGALAVGRLLGSSLQEISERDPITFTLVAILLIGVALTATLLPARRAARVDPAVTLQS